VFSELNNIMVPTEKTKTKTIRRKKCRGGLLNCNNYVGEYKDVDCVGCCEQCDKYVDDNPYDPYWEHMEQEFSYSEEYKALVNNDLLDNYTEYERAFEKYQANYESWPDMRRRMAKKKK